MDMETPPTGGVLPDWIGRRDVPQIPGALRPSAYVARAYLHQKEHNGRPPAWAQKLPGGQWQFARTYIEIDGRDNLASLGISDAARLLGASRRAVQTWVDAGLIPTLQDSRATGESRRIDRAKFERAIPELRARLTPGHGKQIGGRARKAALVPATPPPPAITDDIAHRLSEAAAIRDRLARERSEAEQRLAVLTREERKAAEREARLKAGYAVRMEQAHRDAREADKRRAVAAREAERSAAREHQAVARERRLRESLAQRLAAWRRRSAERIATQIEGARTAWRKPPAAPPGDAQSTERRQRSADAVAAQLRDARENKLRQMRDDTEIDRIAARLAEEVAIGLRDRYDAAILFNELMEKRNAPAEQRIAALKKHFPK